MRAAHWVLILFSWTIPEFHSHGVNEEYCMDHICPDGTVCEPRFVASCVRQPCRPILTCVPAVENVCTRKLCPEGTICVERVMMPCVKPSCAKRAHCAISGTCDAVVCPSSQHCELSETGVPTCIRGIFPPQDIAVQLNQLVISNGTGDEP